MEGLFLYRKGAVGEELFAVLFVIALIFVFVVSVIGVYANYVQMQETISSSRIASSIVEGIFFNNSGTIAEGCSQINMEYGNLEDVKVEVLYWKDGQEQNCTAGSIAPELSQ
ncbi:MAG: hypothetical protein ACE5J7_03815, partial [Candidatus Aenigmatarchaeota archaeon]